MFAYLTLTLCCVYLGKLIDIRMKKEYIRTMAFVFHLQKYPIHLQLFKVHDMCRMSIDIFLLIKCVGVFHGNLAATELTWFCPSIMFNFSFIFSRSILLSFISTICVKTFMCRREWYWLNEMIVFTAAPIRLNWKHT